ncbi:MAG: L,D-transpeptidase family protein [Slackia sp.]|nr:L,D-transpeptidase family protein [Slackia sp.]
MDEIMDVSSSAGCVRLEVQNAKWIYDNIPYGTKAVTY